MSTAFSRRTFLKGTAAGVAGVTTGLNLFPDSLTAAENFTIIDTHTHFYDPSRPQGVPWPPKNDPVLYRTILPKTYKALPKPQPVTATVVVEASPWLEDNQWILDLAAEDKFIVGFVGNLTVGNDEFRKNLKRFAANKLFRGIRVGGDAVKAGLAKPEFMNDLRRLSEQGLALDLLGGTAMLPDVARLAKEIPNLRMIIDHVANIPIDGKPVNPDWQNGMKAAGEHAHVYCKVSGLVEGTNRKDGTAPREVAFYQPVLDTIWNAFGEQRLVYGSNWPVSERFAPCATVQGIVQDYFSAKGKSALESVFSKNSLALYQWVKR